MEYPHCSYRTNYNQKERVVQKKQKPKVVVYFFVAVASVLHFFISVPYFQYIALGFLGYALFKLVTCGCWKAQLRTFAALCLLAMALGAVWRPLMSIGVAIIAFEMFL